MLIFTLPQSSSVRSALPEIVPSREQLGCLLNREGSKQRRTVSVRLLIGEVKSAQVRKLQ